MRPPTLEENSSPLSFRVRRGGREISLRDSSPRQTAPELGMTMARGASLHPRTVPIRASGAADTPQGFRASAPTASVPQTSRTLLGFAPPHFLCHFEARRFLSGRGTSL